MPKKRILIISVTVIVFCIVIYFCYNLINEWQQKKTDNSRDQELKALQDKNYSLKRELSALEEEINRLKGAKAPSEKLEDVFGSKYSLLSLERKDLSFNDVEQMIMAFFSYLDEKRYVVKNKLPGSAYDQYEILEKDLSAIIPTISGETKDLYSLLHNASHFYRVLGKERLSLVKDILTNESDIIEFAMKAFYVWYTFEDDNGIRMESQPSLMALYDYGNYFLNTIGGKSYLYRRDSKIRLLTNFYSVLIIDMANDKHLNSHGIDIRPYIKTTFDDITNHMGLSDKRDYLSALEKLMIKYNVS